MPRPGRKQGWSLLALGATLLTVAAPAYALDCVKKVVNRTGSPQTDQFVLLAGAELLDELLTGQPFEQANQIFGPLVVTPFRYFRATFGLIPSTSDLDPPVQCIATTGFAVADHEFTMLGWNWGFNEVPTVPIADPSADFAVVSRGGLSGAPVGGLAASATGDPVVKFSVTADSGMTEVLTRFRITVLGRPLLPGEVYGLPDPPNTGLGLVERYNSPEFEPPVEPMPETGPPSEDDLPPPDEGGGGDDEESSFSIGGATPFPPLPPRFITTPALREKSSDAIFQFPGETLLQLLGENGTLLLPAGQRREFAIPVPREILQGARLEDLTFIVRATLRDIEDRHATRSAEWVVADRVFQPQPPKLSQVVATPALLFAEQIEGQQDNVGALVPVNLCVDVLDTDRDAPGDVLPTLSRVSVTTAFPDAKFQSAADFQVDLPGVQRTVGVTPQDRQFARFCVPVRVRRETPTLAFGRNYRVTLFFRDADGERSVTVDVAVRAAFRRTR